MASRSEKIFQSYWQGGFEGADHVNNDNYSLSMNELTRHSLYARDDYSLLREFGIKTVRESVGWRLVEKNDLFDFSIIESRARAANELGLQVIWTLCHYGWPNDIDVFSSAFVDRFARYCERTTQYLKSFSDIPAVYSPINEISFLSWAISHNCFPCLGMGNRTGDELKHQFVRAALKGCEAIWQVDPTARVLHCDPIIHIVAPVDRPFLTDHALGKRQSQFDAWDMLCGIKEPQLGGAPHFLDLIGVNYYHSNQWEIDGDQLWWHLGHPLRLPLHKLLKEVYQRYQRPLLLAETSHVGSGRGAWIKEIAQQAVMAQQQDVHLLGVCLYPIIDRPDWDDLSKWHKSGLWEINIEEEEKEKPYKRILSQTYATGLLDAQRLTRNFFLHQYPNRSTHFKGPPMTTLIVFSHLRWEFVYQRPQHLLTRLAEHYNIIFIEEPVFSDRGNFWESSHPAPGVTVQKPYTSNPAPGFDDEQLPALRALLKELITQPAMDEPPIAWFYTPMALPLLAELDPALVIYDCMDELSAFKNSPKQMIQRESALLNTADLVFTGGPSLFRAKQERHPKVYCFPSSVDTVHFEQARDRNNMHPAHKLIPTPRLGYYGVIDERIDVELIAWVAETHPEWQIIVVGPIVKIDPAILPRRPNIHYLGQQPYQALPHLLAGWDVCLLPFALNESTRFISPTKTLEYMAAELPIVSTAISDISELYGDVVSIATSISAFITACETALTQPRGEFREKVAKMKEILLTTSWNKTAEKMFGLIQSEVAAKNESHYSKPSTAQNDKQPKNVTKLFEIEPWKNVVIGAGPTGLSAAYHLDKETLLLDKNPTVGGWCRSIHDKGFVFDYAGHIMFSNDPYVQELYKILLGDNVHWQNREAWIFSKGVHTRYPFQGALYGLPADVIKECIIGAFESHYGISKRNCSSSEGTNESEDCCADGIVSFSNKSSLQKDKSGKNNSENFEDFIYRIWGAGIAKHFAIPYNTKLWKIPLTEMETSWLGGRVPLPDLEEIIEGALAPVAKPMGPNARFGYPLRGGFQALVSGFLPHIKGTVAVDAAVESISPDDYRITLSDGRRIEYKNMISTMPLPELIRCMGNKAPPQIRKAAAALRYVSIRCVNLGVGRENITEKHWIYYPEDTIFHRIFVQGNASPHCNPPGGLGLTCEISYSQSHPLPCDKQELIDRCMSDCIKVGLLKPEDTLITANLVDMPYAYVIYDHERANNIKLIRDWLSNRGIILAGRYSEWEYYNSDHAFIAGKKAADAIKMQEGKSLSVKTKAK